MLTTGPRPDRGLCAAPPGDVTSFRQINDSLRDVLWSWRSCPSVSEILRVVLVALQANCLVRLGKIGDVSAQRSEVGRQREEPGRSHEAVTSLLGRCVAPGVWPSLCVEGITPLVRQPIERLPRVLGDVAGRDRIRQFQPGIQGVRNLHFKAIGRVEHPGDSALRLSGATSITSKLACVACATS
jgi:hypothetical protein